MKIIIIYDCRFCFLIIKTEVHWKLKDDRIYKVVRWKTRKCNVGFTLVSWSNILRRFIFLTCNNFQLSLYSVQGPWIADRLYNSLHYCLTSYLLHQMSTVGRYNVPITMLTYSIRLVSRRSRQRQRERLHATGLSICSSVCLSVCLSPKYKKRDFLKK